MRCILTCSLLYDDLSWVYRSLDIATVLWLGLHLFEASNLICALHHCSWCLTWTRPYLLLLLDMDVGCSLSTSGLLAWTSTPSLLSTWEDIECSLSLVALLIVTCWPGKWLYWWVLDILSNCLCIYFILSLRLDNACGYCSTRALACTQVLAYSTFFGGARRWDCAFFYSAALALGYDMLSVCALHDIVAHISYQMLIWR